MSDRIVYNSSAGAITLAASKAAFLPKSRTLLVADLHLEKGSYLQMAGNTVLPAYDTQETLSRLCKVIEIFDPTHVVALGDSFHDFHAGARMSVEHIETLNGLVDALPRFTWILGNHDLDIPEAVNGAQEEHLSIDGFLLTHLPTKPNAGCTNVCGHLHPKARILLRRRRVSYPCFACSDARVILPSFGAYTGGLSVEHTAIDSELGQNRIFALTTPSGIYPIRTLIND